MSVSVAPCARASSSRCSAGSTQTIRSAPASRQPITAPSPTSPAPKTAHVEPRSTLAVLSAAPIPVERPHAKTQARSSGASEAIFASAISGITVYSANVDVPMKCRTGSPSRDSRVVPSGRKPRFCCSRIARQRLVRGSRQWTHSRHCGEKSVTTWSPGASEETPSPTRSTTPAPSCPSTVGAYPEGSAPDAVYRSVWHTPQATRRTRTSPAFGSARSISCTSSGRPNSSSTAARIFTSAVLPVSRTAWMRRTPSWSRNSSLRTAPTRRSWPPSAAVSSPRARSRARPQPAGADDARPGHARTGDVQGGADTRPRRGDELPPRALRRGARARRRRGPARKRRHAAGDRRARDVQPLRRHRGRGIARRDADRCAAVRAAAHVDARRRRGKRLPTGRFRRTHEQEQRDRGARGRLVPELLRVRAAVDPLQPLDLVHVVPRLGELDSGVLLPPAVDVLLTRVVRRQREPFAPVLVKQMSEVPRAVANVDVRVREIGDAEARAARVLRDALRRARRQLHEPDRPCLGASVRVELALGLDHRGEQRGVEMVLRGVDANVRRVPERKPEARVPRRLRLLQIEEAGDGREDHGARDEPAPQRDRRSSSRTPATKASSSSSEPSLTYEKSARRTFSSSGTSRSSLSVRSPRRASLTSGGAVTTTTRSKRCSPPVS